MFSPFTLINLVLINSKILYYLCSIIEKYKRHQMSSNENLTSWYGAVCPSGIYVYPISSESNKMLETDDPNSLHEVLQSFGDQFANYVSCHGEIRASIWEKRRVQIQWPEVAPEIRQEVIERLYQAGIPFIHEDCAINGEYSNSIGFALELLDQAGIAITQKFRILLSGNGAQAKLICLAIKYLHENNISLTEEIIEALTESGEHANSMSWTIYLLHKVHVSPTKEILELLIPNCAEEDDLIRLIVMTLASCHKSGSLLRQGDLILLKANAAHIQTIQAAVVNLGNIDFPLTREDIVLLAINGAQAEKVSKVIVDLHKSHIPLSSGEVSLLAANGEHVEQIGMMIRRLHQSNIPLTEERRTLLAKAYEAHAKSTGSAIAHLQKSGISFTEEDLMIQSETYSSLLYWILVSLHEANAPRIPSGIPALLTDITRAHLGAVGLILKHLAETKTPQTPEMVTLLATGENYAKAIGRIITTLHQEGIPLTPDICELLAEANRERTLAIGSSLQRFHENKIPLTEEIHKLLKSDEDFVTALSQAIVGLNQEGILLTPKIRRLLAKSNREQVATVGSIIEHLHKVNIPLAAWIVSFLTLDMGHIDLCKSVLLLLHKFDIPLTQNISKLLLETCEARIPSISLAIEQCHDLGSPLIQELHVDVILNGVFPYLTQSALASLDTAGIPLTAEICGFLREANRAHALALLSELLLLQEEEAVITEAIYQTSTTTDGPYHFAIPGHAIVHMKKAGIPLTQKTFDAMTKENSAHLVDIIWAIALLEKAGLLTQENFDRLVAGRGVRAEEIVDRLEETASLDQAQFDQMIREIEEVEWEPCREAAIWLGRVNAQNLMEKKPLLPLDAIDMIVGHFAPPGMPHYGHKAADVADKEINRVLEKRGFTNDITH